jgi:hypothetical protein
MRDLMRLALWGLSAVAAMFIAIYAGTTEFGRERLHLAFADIHEILMPSGNTPIRPLDAREGRRLAETVRGLAADRERLLTRIDTLEHSVEDMTGSIARVEKAAKAAPPPESAATPAAEAAPGAPAAPEDVTSSINPPAGVPMPPPPPGSPAKAEFGLDLGSAASVEALRTAWTAALRRHGKLLEGLHPVVQMRERTRPAVTELRLIAGPLPNAATAARICASMTAAGAICAPALFDGQRLAVR